MARPSPSGRTAPALASRLRRALTVLGLSLALGAPSPGMAQGYDQAHGRGEPLWDGSTVAVVAGLLAIGIIGAIIDDDDDDDSEDDRGRDDRRGWDGRDDPIEGWGRAPGDRRADGREGLLPAGCVRHVGGGRRVLPGRCLERRGFDGRLPEGCRSDLRDGGRRHAVYDLRCLRDAGYRLR